MRPVRSHHDHPTLPGDIIETVKFKGEAKMVKEELVWVHLKSYPLADRQRNTPFHVQDGRGDSRPSKTTVILQKVNELHLSLVHEYLQGAQQVVPREVL